MQCASTPISCIVCCRGRGTWITPTRPGRVPIFSTRPRLWDGKNTLALKGALPHTWAVTSDSIAARVAVVSGAEHLILLKSVTIPEGMDWEEAAERGFVDEWFARTLRPARPWLKVRAVNFREWRP